MTAFFVTLLIIVGIIYLFEMLGDWIGSVFTAVFNFLGSVFSGIFQFIKLILPYIGIGLFLVFMAYIIRTYIVPYMQERKQLNSKYYESTIETDSTNCPNCAARLIPGRDRCEYCGTRIKYKEKR